jgi:TRAP-type transport system periplasmic protein
MKRQHLYKVPVAITVVLLLAMIISLIGASSSSAAQTFKWRFATYGASLTTEANQIHLKMAKAVSDRTNGGFVIDVHPAGALGYAGADHQKVASRGLIDMGETMAGTVSGAPGFLVFGYQGRFKTIADVQKATAAVEKDLQEAAKSFDCRVALSVCRGMAVLHSTKRPFPTMDSLKGVKVRAYNNMSSDTFAALGMVPQIVAYAEKFTALSTGIVEANPAGLSSQVDNKDYEVCKYTNMWPLDPVQYVTFINLSSFNALPKDYQDILVDELKKDENEAVRVYTEIENDGLKTLKSKGVTIVDIAPQELKKEMDILKTLHTKWNTTGGAQAQDIYKKVTAALGY